VRDLGPLAFEQTNPRRGRVVGDGGLPIWSAKVTVLDPWARTTVRTDRQGDFVLPRMPRVPLRIRVEAEGYPPNRRALHPKSEFRPEVIQLVRTVEVRLQVVTRQIRSAGKAEIVLVPLFDPLGGGKRKPIETTTDRSGYAVLTLTPGRYEVRARASQGRTGTKQVEFQAEPRRLEYVVVR
jgi:hypothetical protein